MSGRADVSEVVTVDRRRLVPPELVGLVFERGAADEDDFFSRALTHLTGPLMAAGAAIYTSQLLFLLGVPAALAITLLSARSRQKPASKRVLCAPVEIHQFGVNLDGEAIPWPALVAIRYEDVKRSDGDSTILRSQLELELSDRVVRAERGFDTFAASLDLLHPLFAKEAHRSIALGLDRACPTQETSGSLCDDLLRRARSWLESAEGQDAIWEVSGEYRSHERTLRPAFLTQLEVALVGAPDGPDHGAFAAVVAAELGIESLLDAVTELTRSPHPFVAAVAVGAAVRLNVALWRVPKLPDIAPFLDETNVAAIGRWARGG